MEIKFGFDSVSFGVITMGILFVCNLVFLIRDRKKKGGLKQQETITEASEEVKKNRYN